MRKDSLKTFCKRGHDVTVPGILVHAGVKRVRRRCKLCCAEDMKKYRLLAPEKFKARDRQFWLRRKYNLSPEKYAELVCAQKGNCAICQQPETRVNRYGNHNLSVDHNHLTGIVRGLLCNACNIALGLFKDDLNILRSAIKYLKRA